MSAAPQACRHVSGRTSCLLLLSRKSERRERKTTTELGQKKVPLLVPGETHGDQDQVLGEATNTSSWNSATGAMGFSVGSACDVGSVRKNRISESPKFHGTPTSQHSHFCGCAWLSFAQGIINWLSIPTHKSYKYLVIQTRPSSPGHRAAYLHLVIRTVSFSFLSLTRYYAVLLTESRVRRAINPGTLQGLERFHSRKTGSSPKRSRWAGLVWSEKPDDVTAVWQLPENTQTLVPIQLRVDAGSTTWNDRSNNRWPCASTVTRVGTDHAALLLRPAFW